jgi:hypothetical protein
MLQNHKLGMKWAFLPFSSSYGGIRAAGWSHEFVAATFGVLVSTRLLVAASFQSRICP